MNNLVKQSAMHVERSTKVSCCWIICNKEKYYIPIGGHKITSKCTTKRTLRSKVYRSHFRASNV